MRAVIQRVSNASVTINQNLHSSIKTGLVVLLGIEDADTREDADWLCGKILNLRIFNDDEGKMNLSIKDLNGEFLIVSQFTLFALTKKGNRPSFIKASKPEIAIPLYEYFLATLQTTSLLPVKTGIFGADMKISLVNDGPVTITIDTKNKE
jgi:D-aminoacyl-tRNA deacylase